MAVLGAMTCVLSKFAGRSGRLTCWLLGCLFLVLTPPADAEKKPLGPPGPGDTAYITAAMTAAHTVYLRYGDGGRSKGGYTADYIAFYQGMRQWGRYQLLPSSEHVDLVLIYQASCVSYCGLNIYDGRTMAWIGRVRQDLGFAGFRVTQGGRSKGARKFLETLARYTGSAPFRGSLDAGAAGPPTDPVPAWLQAGAGVASIPHPLQNVGSDRHVLSTNAYDKIFDSWVKTLHHVLIVDEGLSMSQKSPSGRKDGLALFTNEINEWGRYTIVPTLAEADIVIVVNAIGVCGGEYNHCDYWLDFQIEDPKTLQTLQRGYVPAGMHVNAKKKVDDFANSVDDLVQFIRAVMGDPQPFGDADKY